MIKDKGEYNYGLTVNYWWVKAPDLGMTTWAKYRMEPVFPKIESLINEACRGAYQNRLEQNTIDGTDQRLDFMLNVFKIISIWTETRIAQLDAEIKRRKSRGFWIPIDLLRDDKKCQSNSNLRSTSKKREF